ncbi:MAG: hypothetical protein WB709_03330, partial [Solirubrobacteraceae bacterium]
MSDPGSVGTRHLTVEDRRRGERSMAARARAGGLAGAAVLLAGLTLGACGGGGNAADVAPHSTPEITPPSSTQAES